jgi:protein involved in polysaccharide export with SLBB domain/anti-anti-sigma regulatory factor
MMALPLIVEWTQRTRRPDALRALSRGCPLTLDLDSTRSLSEPDLADLAAIATDAQKRGVRPILICGAAAVLAMLEVTRLDKSFDIVTRPAEGQRDQASKDKPSGSPRSSTLSVIIACLGMFTFLTGCAGSKLPQIEPAASYMPEKVEPPERVTKKCPEAGEPHALIKTKPGEDGYLLQSAEPRHGPGDEIRIDITEGEDFSGTYTINLDGKLELPFAGSVSARGKTNNELAAAIRQKLIAAGMFKEGQAKVSVLPLKWAPAQINISGAVFQPGRSVINEINRDKIDPESSDSVGDAPTGRYLDAGIRGGAGVRPDADLANIALHRGSKTYKIDMSGVITGAPVPDVPLMTGDRIFVPSTGCFQSALMRPSQVTQPGIRIFMSNLTVPSSSNSNSAVERYATNVPYGTRLLQGAVSSNCVGGTKSTNASRSVVLVSVNPLNGRTEVVERSVEDLVRGANRDEVNPYLMPNDAIACYDSGITNARDAARALGDILAPIGIILSVL